MKYVYLVLSGLLLIAWITLGNTANPAGLPVPALGKFFGPTEGFWANTLHPLTERSADRSLQLDHPLAEGSIHFDERGVPHIFAETLHAACFLQGYVHAADRLWQMDISTRATEGRLSEILGRRTLDRDRDQIRRGYRWAARKTIDTMRVHFPDDYAALLAYADGINAYAEQLTPDDLPVEYKLLGHQPLRWSPYRTALLMKGMAQSLSSRYNDAATQQTVTTLGQDVYDHLFPLRFPGASPIVPDEGRYQSEELPESTRALHLPSTLAPADAPRFTTHEDSGPDLRDAPYLLMPPHPGNGSNNWAIAAERSNTSYPLLASDPHLGLTLPSIWYECQIHLPEANARGVSLPGAPGIMIGFNDYVAYGETNVGHDVTDWFAISWTDSSRTEYLLDGQPTAARIQRDTIIIKGQTPEILSVPYTHFGPVPYRKGPYADHAMRYLAHDAPGRSVRSHTIVGTFLDLMRAKGYTDYRKALSGYLDPPQNFLFADKSGEIAIRPNGGFPLRGSQNGKTLSDGSKRANNWRGYIPFDERPEHRNPARGFVSSANQVTTGPNYPYTYHGGFDEYRGRRINRSLARERTMNQRKMKELQLDDYSLLAEELVPILLARINRTNLTDDGSRLLRLLSEWNYRYGADSRAATLFDDWRKRVYRLTFDELPSKDGFTRPEVWRWNELLRQAPNDVIFDRKDTPDFVETGATLTQRAFDEILEELDGALPKPWFEARASYVRHLGAIPGFGSELIKSPGGANTPRVLSGGHGASWRMVVELGPTPRAWGALPGGASGDPASEFYTMGLSAWENGRYHELTRWNSVSEATEKASASWTF